MILFFRGFIKPLIYLKRYRTVISGVTYHASWCSSIMPHPGVVLTWKGIQRTPLDFLRDSVIQIINNCYEVGVESWVFPCRRFNEAHTLTHFFCIMFIMYKRVCSYTTKYQHKLQKWILHATTTPNVTSCTIKIKRLAKTWKGPC